MCTTQAVSLFVVALLLAPAVARAEPDTFFLGNGQNGSATLAASGAINTATKLAADAAAGATALTVASGAGFAAGRLVLVHSSVGYLPRPASGTAGPFDLSTSVAGQWELARVASVAGTTLTLTAALVKPFLAANTQVVTVPEYVNLTINAGVVVNAPAWNGAAGGVVAFLASGTVANAGRISADSAGFRGGGVVNDPSGSTGCVGVDEPAPLGAQKGEGVVAGAFGAATTGLGNVVNGAGGGVCHNAGGGGGGHLGAGGRGGLTWAGDGSRNVGGLGGAGLAYSPLDHLTFGGGGGAGQENNSAGSNGGQGGGVVFMRANVLAGAAGVISANGQAGPTTPGAGNDGAGGGGAGGAVYARFVGAAACASVQASGGAGGNTVASHGSGGGGGAGRVLFQSASGGCTLTQAGGTNGTSGGVVYGGQPGNPGIPVVPVGGVVVPAVPTLVAPAGGARLTTGTPTMSGTGVAGTLVVLYADGLEVGRVAVGTSGAWSATTKALAEGAHQLQAAAELDGIQSAKTAAVAVTVDTIAPDTTLTGTPAALSNSSAALFTFASPDATATFECRLDAAPGFTACTSALAAAGLADGAHTFVVRAKDPSGNVDATPASFAWTVDTVAPDTTITSSPAASTNATAASFVFSSPDATAVFECQLDAAPGFTSCATPITYLAPGAGAHTFRVRARDATGNVDASPAAFTWTIDVTVPDTSFTATPAVLSTTATPTFAFTASEPGCTFLCSIDGGAAAGCTSPDLLATLAQGPHTFQVAARDAAGNVDATPAAFGWTVDTVAPDTTLTSTPAAATTQTSASFLFTSNDPAATFECRLDAAPGFAACTSPTSYSGLSEATHAFQVRARDAAGNPDPTPASFTWKVDLTPPDTSIASSPAVLGNVATAAFTFTSTDSPATFACRLDGGAFVACTAASSFGPLADGPHTLQVRASDAALNVDPTPATFGWTLDTQPSDTTLSGGPASPTRLASASFTLSATETFATLECRLDAAAFAACTSPVALAGLADGAHTFQARARDGAGNVDPTPAAYGWTVDTTAPDTLIVSAPAVASNAPSATFDFDATEPGVTYECQLDLAAAFSACTDPLPLGGLAEGAHTLAVRATDAAGNTDPTPATYAWAVDTTAPDTSITGKPAAATAAQSATFDFTASEAAVTFECRVDGAAGFTACTGPSTLASLSDGAHTFRVRATDAAGNVDASPATWTWTVDTVPPTTAFVSTPPAASGSATATFDFTASEVGSTFECRLDGGPFAACPAPDVLAGLAQGAHAFTVRAVDAAGNRDASPPSFTWTVDTAPPDTTIASGPADPTANPDAAFTFTASEAGATFECRLDGASAFAACGSAPAFASLADGAHVLLVRAKDAAGNLDPSPARATWTVDTAAPQTTITSGPPGLSGSASAAIAFSSSEAGGTFACALDGLPFAPCTSPLSLTGLADGAHTLFVRATDAAGNADATPARASWSVDTRAPDTSLTSTPPALSNQRAATFGLASDDPAATFECRLDAAAAFTACATPLALASLADGAHSLRARARDAAGNVDASPVSFSWTIDTVAPATSLGTTPPLLSAASGATFSFGASDPGATFECRLDGGAFFACASPDALTGLADGPHTFAVRAVDAAGNTDPTPATYGWTVDTRPPDTTLGNKPPAITGSATVIFDFTASEPGSTFECRLDAGTFAACPSPTTLTALADGAHTLLVRAKDAAGNVDPTPATWSWTVDGAPVDTSIDSGPAPVTGSRGATFTFSANKAGATFRCRLDGGTFTPCVTPDTVASLADGAHMFEVEARDPAGNVDGTSAKWSWTVDTQAPDTSFGARPPAFSNQSAAAFAFASPEAGVAYECRLDGGAFAACAAATTLPALADGAHTLDVRAKDAANNVDPTPASCGWTIDTVAPTTAVVSGPASLSGSATAAFDLTSNEAGATFECALDGGAFGACSDPASFAGLSDGAHALRVRAKDAAGNVDAAPASWAWTIETSAPDTTIASAPAALSNVADAAFGFASTKAGSTFECRLDTAAAFAPCAANATFPGLSDGAHTLLVRAKDAAGNLDPTPASDAWTIDTVAPTTAIAAGPASQASDTTAVFGFTSEAGATFECALDGGTFATCPAGGTFTGLSAGPHALDVRARDAAGNVDATPATWSWIVDTSAPDTTIASGPAASTATRDASFAFSSTKAGATFECELDGAVAFTACPVPALFAALGDGAHRLAVRARDAAGNLDRTPSTRAWTVDTAAPTTTITSGPNPSDNRTTAPFAFASNEAAVTFECRVDGATLFTACPVPAAFAGLTDGAHTLDVRAKDGAGNVDQSPDTWSWTVDTRAPDTSFIAKPPALSNSSSATFKFASDEAGASFECSLDAAATFTACPAGGTFTVLTDGAHTLRARSLDAAGNVDPTPATWTWTISGAPVDTAITSGPAAASKDTQATFVLASNEPGATFACRLDGGALAPCASPASVASLSEGPHLFEAVASDAFGDTDPTPASYSWTTDSRAPDTTLARQPEALTTSTTAVFQFTADESPATFECRLDGATGFTPCDANATFTSLSDGAHTLAVRAVDAAGNVDASPATATWNVDTRGPSTPVLLSPAPGAALSSNTFAVSGSAEAGASVAVTVDGGAPILVTAAADGSWSAIVVVAAGTRPVHVTARATDAVGNASGAATLDVVVDTEAPDTQIVASPPANSASASATFAFQSTEDGAHFECALDGGPFASCLDTASFGPLAEGGHAVEARSTDAAGNVDPTPATFAWTVDTLIPDTTLDGAPPELTREPDATFVFGSSEAGVAFECSLDGADFLPCPADGVLRALADGPHALSVRARDAAGNVDPTPARASWTLDTLAPDTVVLSGPPTTGTSREAAFVFTASEPGSTFECRTPGGAFESCASPFQLLSPDNGDYVLEVRAKDAAGNVDPTPATWTWSVVPVGPADSDADGLTDAEEAVQGTDPHNADTDSDGLTDGTEVKVTRTNPLDDDTDDDGLLDGQEDANHDGLVDPGETDPLWADTDRDGLQDGTELGLAAPEGRQTDLARFVADADPTTTTDPTDRDTDHGGVFDGYEDANHNGRRDPGETDPLDPKDDVDADGDGAPDALELAAGTDPHDSDSDDDGVADGLDGYVDSDGDGRINALDPDSDGDGLFDGTELGVTSRSAPAGTDQASPNFVPDADPSTTTDPRDDDSDDDGLLDGHEDSNHDGRADAVETDPAAADTDRDGLQDGTEKGLTAPQGHGTRLSAFVADADPSTTTDPLERDTDHGGAFDGFEDANHNGRFDPRESNPNDKTDDHDADLDGISDDAELAAGTDPFDADSDDDGVTDGADGLVDTDHDGVIDALDEDSDGDGVLDGTEAGVTAATAPAGTNRDSPHFKADADPATRTDPRKADTDGDGLSDGEEDKNHDGRADPQETDPTLADTDQDGLSDGLELRGQNRTNPLWADTDGDGLLDGAEDANHDGIVQLPETDPNQRDTDQGGMPDGKEVLLHLDPNDPNDDVLMTGGGCASVGGTPALALVALAGLVGRRRRTAGR